MFLLRKVSFYTVNSVVEKVESLPGDVDSFNLLLFLCVIVPNEPIQTSKD